MSTEVQAVEVVSAVVNGLTAKVILKSQDNQLLLTSDARKLAIAAAGAQGITRAGISNMPSPYPVDVDGEYDEDLFMGKSPDKSIDHWRVEFDVSGGI